MTALLAFVDTETTGLDPDQHEIWEVGLILRRADGGETEHVWQLPVHLGRADSVALRIGRYSERRTITSDPARFALDFARLTEGAHLVGAVISFDEERLRRLLRANDRCPMWHYHLIDVEALAAGWLSRLPEPDWLATDPRDSVRFVNDTRLPPWDSDALSRAVGVDPDQFDRHTALGDARWAKAIYDVVMRSEVTA